MSAGRMRHRDAGPRQAPDRSSEQGDIRKDSTASVHLPFSLQGSDLGWSVQRDKVSCWAGEDLGLISLGTVCHLTVNTCRHA